MSFLGDLWGGITGKTQAKSAERAGELQAEASKYSADLAQKQFEQTRQDQMPWLNAGKKALGGLNDLMYGDVDTINQTLMNDPSYQWRKQQGLDTLQAQASAGGGLLSGATLKALDNYNSNLASQEYNNVFNRLAGIAGTGQNTANNLGQFGANNTQAIGNALTNGANAQANAIMGSANARTHGMRNLIGLGATALGLI